MSWLPTSPHCIFALKAKRSTAFWYIDYWNPSFYDFKHGNPSLLVIYNSELIWKGNKGKEWKFKYKRCTYGLYYTDRYVKFGNITKCTSLTPQNEEESLK